MTTTEYQRKRFAVSEMNGKHTVEEDLNETFYFFPYWTMF